MPVFSFYQDRPRVFAVYLGLRPVQRDRLAAEAKRLGQTFSELVQHLVDRELNALRYADRAEREREEAAQLPLFQEVGK